LFGKVVHHFLTFLLFVGWNWSIYHHLIPHEANSLSIKNGVIPLGPVWLGGREGTGWGEIPNLLVFGWGVSGTDSSPLGNVPF
jgi:hypothetical protein